MANEGLCWKCRALLDPAILDQVDCQESLTTLEGFGPSFARTLKTRETLGTTAHRGCRLCARALASMRTMVDQDLGIHKNSQISEHAISIMEPQLSGISFTTRLNNYGSREDDEVASCFINLHPANELHEFMNTVKIDSNTESVETWSLIGRWITNCNNHHDDCGDPSIRGRPELPKRLIDVRDVLSPRLITTTHSTEPGHYMTLSHCWGSTLPLRLLRCNMEELHNEIPLSQLGKTFRDAITITRRLGIRYLWIDSLCIIQDSSEDWQEQSATMAQVYSNSYCNIAATYAKDASVGCFIEHNVDLIQPLLIHLGWGPKPGWYYAIPGRYWMDGVTEMPLFLRAWAFQELTLAPRTLYFGKTEVAFQCLHMSASETFPNSVPKEVGAGRLRGVQPNLDGPQVRQFFDLPTDHSLNALTLWSHIVKGFSLGRLTYATDKLVALSAIAAMLHEHVQCEYLGGLWRSHLAHQLLWEVRGVSGIVNQRRTDTYVAPTWSWASVTGRVEAACLIRYADDRDIVIEILDVHVKLVSELNPFGQVSGGFICIKGPLAKGKKGRHISTLSFEYPDIAIDGDIFVSVIWDSGELEKGDSPLEDHYCLPIQVTPNREHAKIGHVTTTVTPILGIVLRLVPGSEVEYMRAGKFEFVGDWRLFQAACRQYSIARRGGVDCSEGWGEMQTLRIV